MKKIVFTKFTTINTTVTCWECDGEGLVVIDGQTSPCPVCGGEKKVEV